MTHRATVTVLPTPAVIQGGAYPFRIRCQAAGCPFVLFSDSWREALQWGQYHAEIHRQKEAAPWLL